jgi:hypothetical protein
MLLPFRHWLAHLLGRPATEAGAMRAKKTFRVF